MLALMEDDYRQWKIERTDFGNVEDVEISFLHSSLYQSCKACKDLRRKKLVSGPIDG